MRTISDTGGAALPHPRPGAQRQSLPLRRLLAGAGLAAILAASAPAAAHQAPQPKLPVVRLQAGLQIVLAEVADTPRS
ncbi:MAG: hypothetical protein LC136_11220, partial [Burkholderiales bacterium]|nr:hypothetical protein [Burkholderiales bacterium]